jgi:hypothetical protein
LKGRSVRKLGSPRGHVNRRAHDGRSISTRDALRLCSASKIVCTPEIDAPRY